MCPYQPGDSRMPLLLSLLLWGGSSWAATQMPSITVAISGTVIASTPCKINDDRIIEVNFGNDLLTTKVNGWNYKRTISYALDCRGANSNRLRMQFQGTSASYDGRYLGTINQAGSSRPDLAIRIEADGVWLEKDTWLNFQSTAVPTLTAVPMKAPGIPVTAGRFSAGATLVVEYQ